jgi:glycolate oxidase
MLASPPTPIGTVDAAFIAELRRICGPDHVLAGRDETLVYECDAFTFQKQHPEVVVLPATTEEVSRIVRLCSDRGVPFLGRGAGTGLAGGSLPVLGGVIIAVTRMKAIKEIDLRNRRMLVEAGAVNLNLSKAIAAEGYQYAPDPSSQMACTIGGNVANNSGGPHTLKYGVTVNHVLGVTLVLPSGEVVKLGGAEEDHLGYDLVGLVVGSEGTFGIVTEVVVRIVRLPQTVRTMLAVFESVEDATNTVSGIIAAGIVPAALEMMDKLISQAVEAAFKFGFPLDAGACLIIELDGLVAGIDRMVERVQEICRTNHAREIRTAGSNAERDALWKARKRAFGAAGRLAASEAILTMCVRYGGSITGEHGIGIEKSSYSSCQFSEKDLEAMGQLKNVFDPKGLCNPGKMFPSGHGCVEVSMKKRRSVAL